MTLPALPMSFGTFALLASLLSGIGLLLNKGIQAVSQRYIFSLFFGSAAALALMAGITALGFIPNDWSANRLTWPGGLFYGYRLYLGENGPSNGFFYPPLGAWFYLPAAGLGIIFHSPLIGLLVGWCMSMACIFTPIVLLIHRIHQNIPRHYAEIVFTLSLATILIFSCPPLRYVATMIHVDSPALLFLGLSIVMILPINSDKKPIPLEKFQWAGCYLSLAMFSKQSVWPIMPLIIASVLYAQGRKASLHFLVSALLTFLLFLAIMLAVENGLEAFRMIWQLPTHQSVVTPVIFAAKQLGLAALPLLVFLGLLVVFLFIRQEPLDTHLKRSSLLLFLMALWMIPFAMMTRMRIGADVNHLAIPCYLMLLGSLILVPPVISALFHAECVPLSLLFSFLGTALLAIALSPYLSQSCGWYLWSHNSHQQALHYEENHLPRSYFSWQIYSMLIAEGKLYHLDDCLRYESAAGWKRSESSLKKYLPEEPFQIALRPLGAPSFIAQEFHYTKTPPSPLLKNWEFFQKNP